MECLGFSISAMCHLRIVSLTSFFPIWMPFISFSCLIALDRTSNTMLNKCGDSGHPCLVLNLREKTFSFSPLNRMLIVGLSYMDFIMLCSLYTCFVIIIDVEFCQMLVVHLLRWSWFSSILLMWYITLTNL